jgi:pimeloyl-ACP methyl ester carboxylesterase
MLSDERLRELYGGLPLEITVNASGEGWRFRSPAIFVEGGDGIPFFVQEGETSSHTDQSHIVRRFGGRSEEPRFSTRSEHPVICVSQFGAADVSRSVGFFEGDVLSRLPARDVEVLDEFGIERAVAYGSRFGALGAIALAAKHPKRVAAVVAMNPAGLIRQDSLHVLWMAAKASLQVKRDFDPPPTPSLSNKELEEMMLGGFKEIAASDVGIGLLDQVQCPVLIYTSRYDEVFPCGELMGLGDRFPNVSVTVMEGCTYTSPNTRVEIHRLATHAKRALRKLEIISER